MMEVLGYNIIEKLYESVNSIVYRAIEQQKQRPVIIKVLNYEYPSEEKIAQFKYEYELIKELTVGGVVTEYEFIPYNNSYGIVFEDCGAKALKEIDFPKWKLIDKLQLFLTIVDILAEIHENNIIHKDVSPSNIILNEKTGVVKVIDFGNATKLMEKSTQVISNDRIGGTLAYISPEQTGRMNRVVDYRSDYYSLGATFYEILVQQKVFHNVVDPVELVYCHLAKEPVPPHLMDARIPPMVSQIIMKFLAKNAEDRYQSVFGIKNDLQQCIDQLQKTDTVREFPLGLKDNLNQLHVSQKIYGRKKELATLMAMYEQVCNGGSEFMLVAGQSGIGKSELVHEIQKNVFHSKGYFVVGKYDKHKKNIPYSAIIDVFRDLIKLILTEKQETVAYMKARIQEKVADKGRVITNVIPELEFLIGKQPMVETLPALETQHRFNFVFKSFITSFLEPGKTLVIFLDDLQWADNASIELIKSLAVSKENRYLFLIGSYRDNEVGYLHPLKLAVEALEQQEITINKMTLTPLALEDVNELIADTLHSSGESCGELSQLLYEKTEGNPFFINEFLGQLYEKQLIHFNMDTLSWSWNIRDIKHVGFPSSVIDMVAERVKRQEANTQRVLRFAALIGNRFDYEMLLELDHSGPREISEGLWKALQAGFIQPIGTSYKYINNTKINSNFKFTHDSIQQSIYALITDQEKTAVHLKIGRLIKENCQEQELENRVFDIVTHLNLSLELIQEEQEVRELAELNYIAGKKAKASSAFVSALSHFRLAIQLFGKQLWQREPQKALDLYIDAMETAYSCAEYSEMERYSIIAFEKCNHAIGRMKLYEITILALLARNNAHGAVNVSLEALGHFGIVFPKKISKGQLLYKLTRLKFSLYGKDIDKLVELPPMEDEEKAAVMRLLTTVSSSAYLTAPELFVLMVITQVEISIKYGICLQTPFAFCMYGVILCGLLGEIDRGYRFAKIGLAILKKAENKELAGKTLVVASIFITHWKDKPEVVLDQLMRAYALSQETGDAEYAAWALLCHGLHSFFAGKNIKTLNQELLHSAEKIKTEFKQDKQYNSISTFIQLGKKFYEESLDKTSLSDEEYNEAKAIALYTENNDKNEMYYVYSNKMILNLFFENYREAVQAAKRAEEYMESVVSTINYPVFYFYSTLAYLALYENLDVLDKQKITSNVKKIKKWAMIAPDHHQYKYHLIKAELYRLEKQEQRAAEFFDLAIYHAQQHGFTQDAALAYELAAKFYLLQGKMTIAKAYMTEAHYFYQKWGADEKARLLEASYGHLKKEHVAKETSIASNSWTANQFIDTASIINFAQLLASEMQYDNLIRKMMNILMKNAGAQKGFFLLRKDDSLQVEATANMNEQQCALVHGRELSEFSEELSQAIAHYVLRVAEGVVIDDAIQDKLFAKDSYVEQCKPKSILCIPVVTKNKIMGVLYFENNLTTAAFTQERIEFLKIIASQAAISLENIQMYTNLEEKVKERTREIEIQKSFFQQLFATSPDGIALLDNDFYITNVNSAFENLFQYSLEEVKGKHIDEILVPAEYIQESIPFRAMHSHDTVRFETMRKCKNQTLLDVYITAYPIMAEDAQVGLCVMYSDISTRKQAERQLRYLSLHDALTGVYNRTCFEEEMVRLARLREVNVGIMVCDVDGLKLVNDTLGHEVGDRLIKAAAHIIKEIVGAEDIVARIGGDEFAVLIPNAEQALMEEYSAKLQQAIDQHNAITSEYNLSISVGYAIKEQDVLLMEDAFKEADSNMYQDKLTKTQHAKEEIVKKLFAMLEEMDFFHSGHVETLQRLLRQFGKKRNLSEEHRNQLQLLAQFHDIGKVVLSKQLIYKPGKLSPEERSEVQKHSEVGYRIVKSLPEVQHIAELILKHHEWWDGSGYPLGIRGENIPFLCRLFAVVEAYEVMISGRPYFEKFTPEEAVAELSQHAGSQFDPQLVEEFIACLEG